MEIHNNGSINQSAKVVTEPTTYFDLIQKIGNKGPYQRNLCLIFFLNWFITGLLLMGTSFLFLSPKLNCDSLGLSGEQCQNYVCNLPDNQRQPFYGQKQVTSLATQFGPFYCQKQFQLDALRMSLYLGTFFGYIGVLFITDNQGRKFSIVMAWSLTLLGIFLLSISFNIWMAACGLFLAGIGCESCIRICMAVFGEVVQDILRQKYSTALQISFGIAQMVIGLMYFLIKDWRWVTIGFCLIPAIIQLLLLIFYLEETPKFLIKKDKNKALKSLNRMGRINKKQDNLIQMEDIEKVLEHQVKQAKVRTPLDMCRFKSQRKNFFFMGILFFCITILYYGPSIIISNLSLNIFISQVVFGISQTIAYPICYIFIEKSPRKRSGYILFGLSSIFFLALIFIQPSQGCTACLLGVFQLIIVFAARFCICYYFAILFLFITQLFPLPLRGTGFGMVSVFGSVASTSSQFILTYLDNINFNSMILFTILSVISGLSILFLPETLGKKLSQKIPEEQQADCEINQLKKQNQQNQQNSEDTRKQYRIDSLIQNQN